MEILLNKEIKAYQSILLTNLYKSTAVRLTWTSQHGIESYLFTMDDAIKVIHQLQNKFNIWIIIFKL